MARAKIVVVGSSNTDMIIQLERLPKPGETLLGGEFSMVAGGKGANQAVAAARAGGEVGLIACVGIDMFGKQAVEGFVREGIHVDSVFEDQSASSGIAFIFVDAMGQNSIAVASGANAKLLPAHIGQAKEMITAADILMTQLETPLETVAAAADLAASHGVRVILNPAPACPLDDDLLRNVSILTPNEIEAEALTGIVVQDEAGAEKAADALHARGVGTILITLGARGAYLSTSGCRTMVRGFPVEAVDTTAAGDVFNGALAVALAEETPWPEAVRFANAAAALSVTKLGAQPSAPPREEIEEYLGERPESSKWKRDRQNS